ncbi:Flagellar biosynthetic protein FliR [Buchnera aphidicola (Periphyllus testudinaceus)]|uniref:flagellar biosynthetic protein FliR n=1 Tax=Buchnera aphidicola TaxID=9 RepID=UPI00346465D7
MTNFNVQDIFLIFNNILYPSVRIFFLFYTAPIFNSNYFSIQIKIFLSLMISLIIFPYFSLLSFHFLSLDSIIILLKQILIGILIGFSINLVLFITNISGEIFSFQTGLSFSNFFDENMLSRSSIMSVFLNSIIFLLFLSLDGHLWIIFTIVQSFYIFPIDFCVFDFHIFFYIVQFFSLILINGIHVIFPIIIFLFFLNISLLFLNKFIPQLSIFSIGFSIINFCGIMSFFYFLFFIFFFLNNYLSEIYLNLLNIFFKI